MWSLVQIFNWEFLIRFLGLVSMSDAADSTQVGKFSSFETRMRGKSVDPKKDILMWSVIQLCSCNSYAAFHQHIGSDIT